MEGGGSVPFTRGGNPRSFSTPDLLICSRLGKDGGDGATCAAASPSTAAIESYCVLDGERDIRGTYAAHYWTVPARTLFFFLFFFYNLYRNVRCAFPGGVLPFWLGYSSKLIELRQGENARSASCSPSRARHVAVCFDLNLSRPRGQGQSCGFS